MVAAVVVAVVVAVAGVIFVGHGQGHGDVYVYDHHSPVGLGASIVRGKASLSATFRHVVALVDSLAGGA